MPSQDPTTGLRLDNQFAREVQGMSARTGAGLAIKHYNDSMKEHCLKQTDLADEFGGQSIISTILNGKRELNTRQVKALAARFNVLPAVFL